MELAKIEQLLESYFEGTTTVAEEAQLTAYFTKADVASHLQTYQPMFAGFEAARNEFSTGSLQFPENSVSKKPRWWYGVAASLVIAVGIAGSLFFQPSLTPEEQEAVAAFNKSKDAMILLANNFNKGTEDLAHINQFTTSKNKILK